MRIKSFYSVVIVRVILITLTSLLISFLFLSTDKYPLASLVVLILIIQVILLIGHLNKTNKKITYFFDAVRNNDSTLHFSEDIQSKTEKELNRSLNKVNQLIKEARKDQISQEKYYSYILEKANTGLLTYDKEGHVLLANLAAKKLLGYEHLNHISQLSKVNDKLYLAFQTLKAGDNKVVKYSNEKETVQLSLRTSAITIQNKELTFVTINNIRDELEEQEVESWIRLIRVLTHEIMNSVAPISSLAETLSEIYRDKEKIDSSGLDKELISHTLNGLSIINQRGLGLMTFVDSYRKLTKMPMPKKRDFEVRQFLENIRILVSQEPHFNNVKFMIEAPDDVSINADQEQLTQVMINIVKNALDALIEIKNGEIRLKAIDNEEQVVISVQDNGIGMDDVIKDQIFVPFYTTKKQGTGIGLSLSHHIMRMHGGRLEVESEPGKGTTFSLFV
ncbi:MAG: ATP-binding protein [Bacteroidetes bacterium]|nr:ATP-binding protein [Bacteroidota bacterium]MDA1122471.1 ATP-binding protein [Bacteroidota bacterium]